VPDHIRVGYAYTIRGLCANHADPQQMSDFVQHLLEGKSSTTAVALTKSTTDQHIVSFFFAPGLGGQGFS
jgi:hypothetical protein